MTLIWRFRTKNSTARIRRLGRNSNFSQIVWFWCDDGAHWEIPFHRSEHTYLAGRTMAEQLGLKVK